MFSVKKGITLTEMLVILAIISILSFIAYPNYTLYIRQSRQLQAKTNLGVVYERQLTYASSELKFSESLKEIGAVPTGRIRYNIGTDWDVVSSTTEAILNNKNNTTDLCRCHNDERGKNPPPPTVSCWADPNPESANDSTCNFTDHCYGPFPGNTMSEILTDVGSTSNIPSGGFKRFEGKFEYYAIGCTSPQLRGNNQLDVWSINHKKGLKNIRPGL